jgi:hypothetical protein
LTTGPQAKNSASKNNSVAPQLARFILTPNFGVCIKAFSTEVTVVLRTW